MRITNNQNSDNLKCSAQDTLWRALNSNRFRYVRFIRNHFVHDAVVDFYCPEFKLIIELDGELYLNTVNGMFDALRYEQLGELGYTILRLDNACVMHSLNHVLNRIAVHFLPEISG